MRWHHFRTLLSWLLLVVIPLQGFAAGAACHTGANAAQPAIEALAAAANADASQLAHRSMGHTEAAPHSVQTHDHPPGAAQHPDSAHTSHGVDHQTHKCNACSPCCVSALPSVPVQVLALSALGFSPFPEPLNHQLSELTGGLDRPPRPLPG